MDLNLVMLAGRLTDNIELKEAKNEKKSHYTSFTIAVNRPYKTKEGQYPVDFLKCRAFGQQAEFLSKYGEKGREILVEGCIEQRVYMSKDGQTRQVYEIKCARVELGARSQKNKRKKEK